MNSKNKIKSFNLLAEQIYGSLIVLESYCISQKDIEEMRYLLPILAKIREDSDLLYSHFINLE